MAEGHDIVGSECIRPVSLFSSANDSCLVSELTPNNEYDTSSIKCLIARHFELEGEWVSPCGEKKVFYCVDVPTITWLNKRKLLQFDGPNAGFIQRKLLSGLQCENTIFVNAINNDPPNNTERCHGCSCNCNELSLDLEGTKLDMTIIESRQERAIACNFREIQQIKAEVNKMSSEYEKINCMMRDLNSAKSISDANNGEIISRLRDENDALRKEKEITSNTIEALTLKLCKRKAMANFNESVDAVVTTYVNSNPVEATLTQTVGSSQPTNVVELPESCTSIFIEPQNTQPCFVEQIKEHVQKHRTLNNGQNRAKSADVQCSIMDAQSALISTETQLTQPCFDDQMKDYVQKHKRSNHYRYRNNPNPKHKISQQPRPNGIKYKKQKRSNNGQRWLGKHDGWEHVSHDKESFPHSTSLAAEPNTLMTGNTSKQDPSAADNDCLRPTSFPSRVSSYRSEPRTRQPKQHFFSEAFSETFPCSTTSSTRSKELLPSSPYQQQSNHQRPMVPVQGPRLDRIPELSTSSNYQQSIPVRNTQRTIEKSVRHTSNLNNLIYPERSQLLAANCIHQSCHFVPSITLANVMSLSPKIDEIRLYAQDHGSDNMCFTETWLKDTIDNTNRIH